MSVFNNTPYEIVLNPISDEEGQLPPVLRFEESSLFSLSGDSFAPLKSFNNKGLSISNDHYHMVSLINQKLKGEIVTITADGTAYMDLTITDLSGFDSEALLLDGTIIDNCKVILYNPFNTAYTYETTSVSYISGVLKLRVRNSNRWDISS